MFRIFLVLTLSFSSFLFSQKVSGLVTDEDHNPIPAVLVFNMKKQGNIVKAVMGEDVGTLIVR